MARLRASLLLLCLMSVMVDSGGARKNWVMLLSGARGYYNYSLQSMVYHACNSLLKLGISNMTLVHMNYDDVATAPENPVQHNLVTLPNGTDNWYPGCRVDYSGKEVTPDLFLKVLSGDKEGVRRILGDREGQDHPVIDSGPDDHIFLYMADHGGPHIFGFPEDLLDAKNLTKTLKLMHRNKRYAKMLIYMEACLSGSMFEGLLPNHINIMAITASKSLELAYACCYDEFRHVYVGGQFDNAWAYDTDKADVGKETVEEQYEVMKKACGVAVHKSHPQEYGDLSFNRMKLQEFQGKPVQVRAATENYLPLVPSKLGHLPYSRTAASLFYEDIDLIHPPLDMLAIATPARRLLHETDIDQQQYAKNDLQRATEVRRQADQFFTNLLNQALGEWGVDDNLRQLIDDKPDSVKNLSCYQASREQFIKTCPGLDPFQFVFVRRHFDRLVQLCNILSNEIMNKAMTKAVKQSEFCMLTR